MHHSIISRSALTSIIATLAWCAGLLLCACGGGGITVSTSSNTSGQTGDVEAASAIAEIMSLETPANVDEATFAMLKSTLAAMVESLSEGRCSSALPSGDQAYIDDLSCYQVQYLYSGIAGLDSSRSHGEYLLWTINLPGDYNHDQRVTVADLTLVGQYYGEHEGGYFWDSAQAADGNGDGAITVADLTPIGQFFDTSLDGYYVYASSDYHDHPAYHDGINGPGAELVYDLPTLYSYGIDSDKVDIPVVYYLTDRYYWVVPYTYDETGVVDKVGPASNLANGRLYGWPTVHSIEPANGLPGTEVTITGFNFGDSIDDGYLQMGGLSVPVMGWSETEIRATIPPGASNGRIRVHAGDFFADTPRFNVAARPSLFGVAPAYLSFGQPFSVDGEGFGTGWGAGVLLVGNHVQPVARWTDTRLEVDSLDALSAAGTAASIQVVAFNGLESELLYLPGDYTGARVTVDQLTAVPSGYSKPATVLTFTVEIDDEDEYEFRLIPHTAYPDELVEDEDPELPGIQYRYTYKAHDDWNPTGVLATHLPTGRSFLIAGPTVFVVVTYHPALLLSVSPVDFGEGIAYGPNDGCYLASDGSYHDLSFIRGEPYITSSLTDLTEDGVPLPSYQRDLASFLKGGSDPRPVCWRYEDNLSGPLSSTMSVRGGNLEDCDGLVFNNHWLHKLYSDEFIGWDGNDGSVEDEIRFALTWGQTEVHCSGQLQPADGEDLDSGYYPQMICSPLVYYVRPSGVVSLAGGSVGLTGRDMMPQVVPGQAGTRAYSIWHVPVRYTSPWSGEEETGTGMLVSLVPAEITSRDYLQFPLSGLDPDGDGVALAEVLSPDGFTAALVDATLLSGEYEFFLWTGVLDNGLDSEIARSGVFSEMYSVVVTTVSAETVDWTVDVQPSGINREVPLNLYLDASLDSDVRSMIVDYEWDLDGDGIFNETNTPGNSGDEAEARGNWYAYPLFNLPGEYTASVRVTDQAGHTETDTVNFTLVDEFVPLKLKVSVEGEPSTQPVPVIVECYDGVPGSSAELLDSHEVNLWKSSAIVSITTSVADLPHGEYWVRLVHPEVWWGDEPVPDDGELPGYYDLGPLAVPHYAGYEISGVLVQ